MCRLAGVGGCGLAGVGVWTSWGGVCDGCGLVLVGVVIYYFSTLDNRMIGMT